MRNRQYETHLRLNEKEHKKLCELAKKAGVTKSAVLRKPLIGRKNVRHSYGLARL